ncbi:hypothetical protein [Alkalihalobacillus sp. LMS39]|uniref:hypothetical protein n=1 Tax=Alkalihalobacillus sp. LMS39 TaxID=2924032 RepID=UPI001FB4C1F4|nr:hypothetical protein [Alkalihalobacillus sp. LMS39]UOE94976.1 hypothetical protein MM271_04820 [Alkalihalobacillus sp. LMS39]
MFLRIVNIILASAFLLTIAYRFIVDNTFEPFQNFFLYFVPLLFLMVGIEYAKEKRKLGFFYIFVALFGFFGILMGALQ